MPIPRKAEPPTATTRSAAALGLTAMTVSGGIHPHGLYTTYYFEYGPTPAYGARTPARPLPPRLAAHYHESWDENCGGWMGGMSGADLKHHPQDGAAGGFVRFSEPSGYDDNHEDGIGGLHLPTYVYPGPLGAQSLRLGGGDPDLRDAQVSLHVRGVGWEPNGSELVWWTQSQSNIERMHGAGWRRANWAYTAVRLTDHLRSGRWEKVEYRLLTDPDNWTYGGDNRRQANCERYEYWPITESMEHLNCDFFHLLAFVDPRNPPKGSIDFDEFHIVYRNHSLVFPSNGGKLLSWPKESPDDPAALTDGWRYGPGRVWRSAPRPTTPQEFVYAFEKPATIRAVQLHQNPEWPARDVEVTVSTDEGKSYAPLTKAVLPENGVPNANFAFALIDGLSAKADRLKVRILSGYRAEHWGLGEIEAFGSGATMLPDDDVHCVTADIAGLQRGAAYHYRLVATNDAGTTSGADQTCAVPADARPVARTGAAARIAATSATLEGRLHAMGLKTEFHFEYGPTVDYGSKSAVSYGGLQITPRLVLASLTDLKPGTSYHYRLVATNEKGTTRGDDAVFRTGEAP